MSHFKRSGKKERSYKQPKVRSYNRPLVITFSQSFTIQQKDFSKALKFERKKISKNLLWSLRMRVYSNFHEIIKSITSK